MIMLTITIRIALRIIPIIITTILLPLLSFSFLYMLLVSANSHTVTMWDLAHSTVNHEKAVIEGHQHNIPAIGLLTLSK